jgi:hypothetical protein
VLPSGQTCDVAAQAAQMDVVWTVGTITLVIGIAAAVTAYFTQETYRIHMNDLGNPNAVPVPLEEYHRIRTTGVDEAVH